MPIHDVSRDKFAFTSQSDSEPSVVVSIILFKVIGRASRKKNLPAARFLPTYKTHTRTSKAHISRSWSGLKKQYPRFLAVERSAHFRQRGDCSRWKRYFFSVI